MKLRISQLAQSGAVTGNAPVWNGTEWVPTTASGGSGIVTVAKRYVTDGTTAYAFSNLATFTEWNTALRHTFTVVKAGDAIQVGESGYLSGTADTYHDFAVVNPSNGAIIRTSSPGTHGLGFGGGTTGAIQMANTAIFVVEAADIISGSVTVSHVFRSEAAGSKSVLNSAGYRFQFYAIRFSA